MSSLSLQDRIRWQIDGGATAGPSLGAYGPTGGGVPSGSAVGVGVPWYVLAGGAGVLLLVVLLARR